MNNQQRYTPASQPKIHIAAEESVVYKSDDFLCYHNDRNEKTSRGRLLNNSHSCFNPQQQQQQQPSAKVAQSNNTNTTSGTRNKNKNNNNNSTIMFSTRDERFFVKIAKNIDILIGRGKPYQIHPGNRIMRRLVAENKDLYNNSPRDSRKAVALNLLEGLTKCGVRFLKRCIEPPRNAIFLNDNDYKKVALEEENLIGNNNIRCRKGNKENDENIASSSAGSGGETFFRGRGCWELASKDEACEKLCHALRFKPPVSSDSKTPPKSLLAKQQHQQQQQSQRLELVLDDQIGMVNINDENSNNDCTSTRTAAVDTPQPAVCNTATGLRSSHYPDQLDSNNWLHDINSSVGKPPSLPPPRYQMTSILQDLLDQQSRLSESTLHPALGQESGLVSLLRDRMSNLPNDFHDNMQGNQHYHSSTNSAISGRSRRFTISTGIGIPIEQMLLFSQGRNQHVTALNDLARYALSRHEHIRSDYHSQQSESWDILESTVRRTILDCLVSLLVAGNQNI